MPAAQVYHQVRQHLQVHLGETLAPASLERLSLLVVGILKARHAAPARIAQALHTLGLSDAQPESIERRIRRIENDPDLTAAVCLHPFAAHRLVWSRPTELYLILDPTSQDDRVLMVTVAVWYRGQALPLAWLTWAANTPLTAERFWPRVAALLDTVARLLPCGVRVTWLADRAFGTPAFIDLVRAHGWHYVVRVQDQTRVRSRQGREQPVRHLVRYRQQRVKSRAQVFKKHGWRTASVVVHWGRRHRQPLAVVSDLPLGWYLLALYRRRFPIEALFRAYKSQGWRWEQGQVTDLEHLERLLVGMALAAWLALLVGTAVGADYLAQPPTGRRYTRPYAAKYSLFQLGLQCLEAGLCSERTVAIPWCLTDWAAPCWSRHLTTHQAYAFVWTTHERVEVF